MTDRPVANHRFALDDLGEQVDIVLGKQHANAFADGHRVSTDGYEKTRVAHTNPNVARETQDAFGV
jgi:hypothetical protein